MDRIIPIIALVAIIVLVGVVWVVGIYNGEVGLSQKVDKQWANVETEYTRRFDLIPSLVNVVKGSASFEQETLTQLTELRSQWQTQTNVNDRIETANQFETTLSKLLVISENYPVLQSSEQFQTLMIQLEGTENRISVERLRYNEEVRAYNTFISIIPNSFFLGGKIQKEYFNAPSGAENAPPVPTDFTN